MALLRDIPAALFCHINESHMNRPKILNVQKCCIDLVYDDGCLCSGLHLDPSTPCVNFQTYRPRESPRAQQ